MSFDLPAALRRLRPQQRRDRLNRREDAALPFVNGPATAGPELLLDTCVYIDVLQGRTPLAVDDLLGTRLLNHSTICLAELTHAFGRLDPQHAGTRRSLATIAAVIHDIPAHRLFQPSRQAMGEAGILAGMVSRLTDQAKADHPALLNDAMIYLQAVERGQVVLTRNLRDFDLFDQLRGDGRVVLYRPDRE